MAVPRISDAEWQVMNVIWERREATAAEVVEALGKDMNWTDRTVKTLLNRLVGKKALAFSEDGKRYVYHAKVPRQACVRAESKSLAGRVFSGSIPRMLMHFVRDADLSKDEIAELKRIIADKASER
jgi:BlaI family transcriptional regulator, penicillinase repressor